MPHIHISMYPGRDRKIKEDFAKKLQELTVRELGCAPGHVSVSMEDVPKDQWQEEVADKVDQELLIIKPDF